MSLIKSFAIFKTKQSDNEKAPTHRINCKIGEEYVELGACWTKSDKNGNKFLSCKLQDVYKDHTDRTRSKEGYAIENEKNINKEDFDNEQPPAESPTKPQEALDEAF